MHKFSADVASKMGAHLVEAFELFCAGELIKWMQYFQGNYKAKLRTRQTLILGHNWISGSLFSSNHFIGLVRNRTGK
jgi:hypothetical protein